MKHSLSYRYPLRLDPRDKRKVEDVARATGSSISQVLVISIRKGLPFAREALGQQRERLTNVKPLPDEVWRRIYAGKDELELVDGDELKRIQSQREPE